MDFQLIQISQVSALYVSQDYILNRQGIWHMLQQQLQKFVGSTIITWETLTFSTQISVLGHVWFEPPLIIESGNIRSCQVHTKGFFFGAQKTSLSLPIKSLIIRGIELSPKQSLVSLHLYASSYISLCINCQSTNFIFHIFVLGNLSFETISTN